MQYQLKIEQLVTYPRCRIYRKFLESLSADGSIRTNGSSRLFYFLTLCSLANFRKSTLRIDGITQMDIVLDLWLNAIYKDDRIAGSDVGPVVYYRNGTHSPLIGYEDLGRRWGVSKSTAGRILRKLEEHGYLKLVPFQGNYGTAIYLNHYLSTMFNISDVTVDKEEVALSLGIHSHIPEDHANSMEDIVEERIESACQKNENAVRDDQISVPEMEICVPKSHLILIVRKVAKVIFLQGIACASCTHARYRLSYLSDDCGGYDISSRKSILTELLIRCPGGGEYRFTVDISPYPAPLSQSERLTIKSQA